MSARITRSLAVAGAAAAALSTALVLAPSATAAPVHTFTGVVLSPSGEPVPNVWVNAGEDVPLQAYTDANGRFRIRTDLNFTHAYLCAKLAQDAPQGGAAGWYDVCKDVQDGTPATLRFKTGAAVGGVVVDVSTGRPLAGALVGVWDTNDSRGYSVTADTNGYYHYRNLRPGANIAPAGVAVAASTAAPYGYGDIAGPRSGAAISLRAGEVDNSFGMQAAPLVRYQGTVVDGNGTPVSGARVAVQTYRPSDEEPHPAAAYVVADGNGAWSSLQPKSGVADVCAWGPVTPSAPTGLALSCTVSKSKAFDVTAPSTVEDPGGVLKGAFTVEGGTPATARAVQVVVGVGMGDGGTFWLPGTTRGGTATVASLPTGNWQARLSVKADSSTATAVAYSAHRVVGPTRTVTFPAVTLQVGD